MSHLSLTSHAATVAPADHELWRLSRRATDNAQLRAIIESCDSWQIPAVLSVTSAGRAFLAELDAYDRRTHDASSPSWTDDPTPVVESLRDLMREPDREAQLSLGLAA